MMERKEPYRKLIIALSIVIPLVIAALFRVKVQGYDFRFLPGIYATINGITAVLLLIAYIAIKRGRRNIHMRLMKTCIGLSAAFLAMYVLYHMTTESTPFGGTGSIRYVYFFILTTHILLSVLLTPLILLTFSRALAGNFERHRALAKFALPIWLYVAVTGVVVYLMISPYYK